MPPEQQRLSVTDRANLVAYLDGELPDPEARAIATKLTHSISARRELEALERTWELLDYLARPKASPELTARTLSLAQALDARGDILVGAAGRLSRRLLLALALMAAFGATAGTAYAAVRFLWPDPTGRLARDLSVAEHLDEYREIGSFEFLKLLDAQPEFNADAP